MHFDWNWIKQRSHFIAEGLADFCDIKIIYMASKDYFRSSTGSNENKMNIPLLPVFRLPFYQNKWIYKLNQFFILLFFKYLLNKYDPDFVWITFPQLYDYIPQNHRCNIIYDCMDLSTGFDYKEDFKSILSDAESRLINDSAVVFVSSNELYNKLDETYHCSEKLVLVRNAFGGKIICDSIFVKEPKRFKIGYFGSIHHQLIDFDALKRTLEEIDCIEYHFIGPVNDNVKMEHDRIKFYGVINHKDLYNYVKNFDCLILPFKLDKLVKFADPVKLYEYINYNKPIISVYYKELEYFSQFLYFYSSQEDLVNILNQMIKEGSLKRYSDRERLEFLKNNSWDLRINKIVKSLEEI